MKRVTCNSSNLIYMIQCTLCGSQYVGQTKNQLLKRINQHYSDINKNAATPVSRHFNSHEYNGFHPVKLYVLQLIRSPPDEGQEERNKWENYWMARLNTVVPNGMNIQD